MAEDQITYKLIRSARKSLAIHITKNAAVEVRAPLAMRKEDIERFVSAKEKWIRQHLSEMARHVAQKSGFSIEYGDMLSLCGKKYPLQAKDGNRLGFDGKCFYIPSGLSEGDRKLTVVQVYKMAAKRILTDKTLDYAKRMNVHPLAIKINSAKTHWGSCSGRNSINFSWRLVMADEETVDYVVVHELAHIKEHNHSDRFWAVVAEVLPDYRERRERLRALQKQLAGENWD